MKDAAADPPGAAASSAPISRSALEPSASGPAARGASTGPTRGRRQHELLGIRTSLDPRWRILLGTIGVISVFGLWTFAAYQLHTGSALVPTPAAT